ncbi:MAG TPA: hypothetical protein DCG38_04920 [Eubacteriaceae bacterium]|jgi:predicted ferric reductase|nr:hypothetical protein [Eubacteriaceae bacterium]
MDYKLIWLGIALMLTAGLMFILISKIKFSEKIKIISFAGWLTFVCYFIALDLPEWTLYIFATISLLSALFYRLKYKKLKRRHFKIKS